jgi:hypothetical protein
VSALQRQLADKALMRTLSPISLTEREIEQDGTPPNGERSRFEPPVSHWRHPSAKLLMADHRGQTRKM